MSDKNLLSEGTVRRFMKLAEIEPLTQPFVSRMKETVDFSSDGADYLVDVEEGLDTLEEEDLDEVELDEDLSFLEEDEEIEADLDVSAPGEPDAEGEAELAGEEPGAEAELDVDEPLDDEDAAAEDVGAPTGVEDLLDQLVDTLREKLEDLISQGELSIEPADADVETVELPGAEAEGDSTAGLETDDEPLSDEDDVGEEDVETMVAEVARRVAKRILDARR